MNVDAFFFRLYARPHDGGELRFVGSCFPVTTRGDLLTCRHVAEVDRERYDLVVHDNLTRKKLVVREVLVSDRADLAVLRTVLPEGRSHLPILTPGVLKVGAEVFTYGFWQIGGTGDVEQGYFAGHVISFAKNDAEQPVWTLVLPFPSVEGMSGAPVITYHNGPKVVGVLYGNRDTRVKAQEVVEVTEGGKRREETAYRCVEFGLAYHYDEIIRTLVQLIGNEGWGVSNGSIDMPGL